MTFTVVAPGSVDATLAQIWTDAADRQAVTDAANWLDRELKVDPLTKVTAVDNLFSCVAIPWWCFAESVWMTEW